MNRFFYPTTQTTLTRAGCHAHKALDFGFYSDMLRHVDVTATDILVTTSSELREWLSVWNQRVAKNKVKTIKKGGLD